jgi:hypothetical protein
VIHSIKRHGGGIFKGKTMALIIDSIEPTIEKTGDNTFSVAGCVRKYDTESGRTECIYIRDLHDSELAKRFGYYTIYHRFDMSAVNANYVLKDIRGLGGYLRMPFVYYLNGSYYKSDSFNAACALKNAGFLDERIHWIHNTNRYDRAWGISNILRSNKNELRSIPFYDEVSEIHYSITLRAFLEIDNLKDIVAKTEWEQYRSFFKEEYKLNLKTCNNEDIAIMVLERRASRRY